MDHTNQCQIQGRGLGPPNPHSAPLFLVQTEAQMAEKSFFETGPPFSQDLDDSPPPPLSGGLDPPLQTLWATGLIYNNNNNNNRLKLGFVSIFQ